MKKSIIIVAGGKGLRVGGEIPKQFIPLGGKPLLMHTLDAFFEYDHTIEIVLVLPESHQEYWQTLCSGYKFTTPHIITLGGETRYHSVKNGLQFVSGDLVGIHDGARPFVSSDLIKRCYDSATIHSAVIPVIDATDSLRQVTENGNSEIIDRSKIKLVQTPQVFSTEVLKKAYDGEFKELFTDDASVVEEMGVTIFLEKGESENIKVTTPIDLKIGELILNDKK